MALKILSVLVENKPGTLFRVTHMIRLMRLNIEGLTCGVTNGGDRSRITMTVNGDDATLDFLAKQLSKVIDVYEAQTYSPEEVTARELALVKLNLSSVSHLDDKRLQGARIVETSDRSITVEVIGTPSEIDRFIHRFDSSHILELARTGTTAVPKG
ncbi:MAG: acetolactate synthase small subunit [Thaumarchaeota archaeon]|nr:MAG: acetolactate synthase small subunit [Nitrososphaerota archaeon]TLX99455.1 MAG: acetolactate synthase small subunit [Nitrososphaerota archaeon]